MCMHIICVQVPAEAGRGFESSRAGVIGANVGAGSQTLVPSNNRKLSYLESHLSGPAALNFKVVKSLKSPGTINLFAWEISQDHPGRGRRDQDTAQTVPQDLKPSGRSSLDSCL